MTFLKTHISINKYINKNEFCFFLVYTLMWNTTLVEKSLKANLDTDENKIF